jgi:hypothetical protein
MEMPQTCRMQRIWRTGEVGGGGCISRGRHATDADAVAGRGRGSNEPKLNEWSRWCDDEGADEQVDNRSFCQIVELPHCCTVLVRSTWQSEL